MDWMFWLMLLISVYWSVNTIEMIIGMLFLPKKIHMPDPGFEHPKLSVIIPARNEAHTLPHALKSLAEIQHPNIEWILINDRSTDDTAAILDDFSRKHTQFKVVHIDHLPDGWLGKTHAMERGSAIAQGEWLLFTDADVHFSHNALSKAVFLAESHKADHLVLLPKILSEGWAERAFTSLFFVLLAFHYRIWQASWSWAPGYIGIGAFNMIRRSTYEAIGTHKSLKLDIVDDLHLGKRVKAINHRQLVANGSQELSVRWIEGGARGIVANINKNAFAGAKFSPARMVFILLGVVMLCLFPFAMLFVSAGTTWTLALSTVAIMGLVNFLSSTLMQGSSISFYLWPFSACIMVWGFGKSMWDALASGQVSWRDTSYTLDELRTFLKTQKT